jgi:syntaxin-binding protein 5
MFSKLFQKHTAQQQPPSPQQQPPPQPQSPPAKVLISFFTFAIDSVSKQHFV